MEETASLPAYLQQRIVQKVCSHYRWGDILFLVRKRRKDPNKCWYVVTIVGEQVFEDGPYIAPNAIKRFEAKFDYLQAVLGHFGALQPAAAVEQPDPLPILCWTEEEWERSWQVASRRLIGAPAIVAESSEFQAIKAELDRAFMAGDVRAFTEAAAHLIQRCQQVSRERGIEPWWLVAQQPGNH